MGSFHTRKLSFFLHCIFLFFFFFLRLGIRSTSSRKSAVLPPQVTCCHLLPTPPGPGTWLPGKAIYLPRETGEGAKRRTQPTARLLKPRLKSAPHLLGAFFRRRPSDSRRLAPQGTDREGWKTGADHQKRGEAPPSQAASLLNTLQERRDPQSL